VSWGLPGMSTAALKTWIQARLSEVQPTIEEPSPHNAAIVAELKQRCYEAGLYELSLSLPIERTKHGVSVAAQLQRILNEIDTPAPPAAVPTNGLFNLEQAAAYLGYKPEGLRKIVKLKQIQFSQNGRGPIRFRREWLDEFTEKNAGGPKDVDRSPAKRKPTPLPLPAAAFGFDPSHIRG
jgi:hypothetical protein